jgi:hypothetical protein
MFTTSIVIAEDHTDTGFKLVERIVACSNTASDIADYLPYTWQDSLLFTSDVSTYTMYEQQLIPDPGKLLFIVNQDTGIFKAVVLYPGGAVCELITGTNFEPYVGERQ